MALSVAPVLREDGTIREWVGSHTDITERKEDEAQLSAAKDAAEAANRAKSAFLANMSHELRTPLSAVIGYSEMMEEEVEDMGEQGLLTDLGKIKSNARHLLSLINDVLDRNDGGTARQVVPALRPGGRDDDPQVRRHGPGTGAHARLQSAPRRRHHGREYDGRRYDLYAAPPRRHAGTAGL